MRSLSSALLFMPLVTACAPEPNAPRSGAQLYREQNCVQCHGPTGEGTQLGPSIADKLSYWKRESLAEFLADPIAYSARDERLAAQGKQYLTPMVKFLTLSEDERLRIADYVLALP
jgi:mono/diheme cytochrome c family protein